MENLEGRRFAFLTVVSFYGNKLRSGSANLHQAKPIWVCTCDCGARVEALGENLKSGNTKSCGCKRGHRIAAKVPPEHYRSTERMSWRGMHARCYQKSNTRYNRYGGRGIRVCERWNNFENFLSDMGPKPSPQHSIDRIDNDGNYEPSNCRWSTHKEQRANRSDSKERIYV